jgi:hypothetical protein
MLMRIAGALGLAMAVKLAIAQEPPMGPLRPDQTAFFALYKEPSFPRIAATTACCAPLASPRC